MDDLTIKVPGSIHEAIEVQWAGQPLTEPMGVTELKDLLAMALRQRVMDKRTAGEPEGEGGNFYGATDHIASPG